MSPERKDDIAPFHKFLIISSISFLIGEDLLLPILLVGFQFRINLRKIIPKTRT